MKKVESTIRSSRLEQVKEALKAIGVDGITVTNVSGIGQEKGRTITYRGAQHTSDSVSKAKLEMIVDDNQVDDVVDTICVNAHTGDMGDGDVLVFDLMSATRIRTGEFFGTSFVHSY